MRWKLGIVPIVVVILVVAAFWQVQRGRRAARDDAPIQTDELVVASARLAAEAARNQPELTDTAERTRTPVLNASETEIDLPRLGEAWSQGEMFGAFPDGRTKAHEDAASHRRMNIERGMKADELGRRDRLPYYFPETQVIESRFNSVDSTFQPVDPQSLIPNPSPPPCPSSTN